MISQLRGTVTFKDIRFIVLNVAGVGYKVFVTPAIIEKMKDGE